MFHEEGRAGGRRDMTEPIVSFRNFANTPERYICTASSVHITGIYFFLPGIPSKGFKIFWMLSKRRTGVIL